MKHKKRLNILTCISSSLDWMSGVKTAGPQMNGSNGSAPNRSISTAEPDELVNHLSSADTYTKCAIVHDHPLQLKIDIYKYKLIYT